MKPGNGGDYAQSEATSRSAAAAFEPVKALENVGMLVDGKSRPVIADGNDRFTIAGHNLDGHPARLTAMLDRIIDEVGNRIEQEVSIARDEYRLIAGQAEMRASFFRRCIE